MNDFIPVEKIRLYHVTSTGEHLETLKAFLTRGISIHLLDQEKNKGFYMWTTEKLAFEHAEFLGILEKVKGHEMLVCVSTVLNPESWTLDPEVHGKLIVQFLWDNWNFFLQLPESTIELEIGFLSPSESIKDEKAGYLRIAEDMLISHELIDIRRDAPHGVDTREGRFIGKIYTAMKKKFPKACMIFEKEIFDKNAKEPGLGVKYTGDAPLLIEKILVQVNGNWIDGKTLF